MRDMSSEFLDSGFLQGLRANDVRAQELEPGAMAETGGARRGEEEPGGDRKSQEEPGGVLTLGNVRASRQGSLTEFRGTQVRARKKNKKPFFHRG